MKNIHKLMCLLALLASVPIFAAQTTNPEAGPKQNGLESLQVSKSGSTVIIKIGLRDALVGPPSSFSIANPARLVFDLPATDNALGFNSKTINDGGLRSLNVVQAGDRSRLVLNLEKSMRFETRQEGKFLLVTLLDDGGSSTQSAGTGLQKFSAGDPQTGQSIRDIQFRRGKDGAGVVAVELSSVDGGVDIFQKGTTLMVSFKKARLPEQLRRQLDVSDFATPISTVKTKAMGDDVLMEIMPKGLWEHTAFQTDNQFIVEVRPLKEDPGKLFQGSKTGYQGEAISLNFQNIPLRELLHVFADITNFNIVVSDSVVGNVSLRLNDVPWDHALEIVLQQKNLSMRKSGNVLWIAPRDELAARDKLEVEAREAAVAAEHPRMEVFQLNYQKVDDFAAMVSGNSGAAGGGGGDKNAPPGGFLSAAGKISIDKRTNQAFINDVPSRLELIRGLLLQVDRPARQVLIEARIVEASIGYNKSLGVRLGGQDLKGLQEGRKLLGGNNTRWGISGSQEQTFLNISDPIGTPLMKRSLDGTATSLDTALTNSGGDVKAGSRGSGEAVSDYRMGRVNFVNLPIQSAAGSFALSLFDAAKTKLLTMEFTAMELDTKVKTLANPRVMTTDKVLAKIGAGEKIPYKENTASGAASVRYVDALLSLEVLPQITPDGRILMEIKITKNELGRELKDGWTVYMKEVKTEAHVENGGTVVIGGIFTQDDRSRDERIPFLGDLPYVGFLFKQKIKSETRGELIIMLTPRIMDDNLSVKL